MKRSKSLGLLIIAGLFVLSSCGTQRHVVGNKKNELNEHLATAFSGYHFGCRIEYLNSGDLIYSKQDTVLFTPASNTKVLTLCAALKYLGPTIPWLEVIRSDERTVLLPLADPSFEHPYLPTSSSADSFFLKNYNTGDTVYMSFENYHVKKYGPGWSWDDGSYYYQVEKSAFPIHGNIILSEVDSLAFQRHKVDAKPAWSDWVISLDTNIINSRIKGNKSYIVRDRNRLYELPVSIDSNYYSQYFKSKNLNFIPTILSDEEYRLGRDFKFGGERDTVLKYFMKVSDNFIAEQLLLCCAHARYGVMSDRLIRNHLILNEFEEIQDQIIWRDGSGLSRYNQISPYAMTRLFAYLNEKLGTKKLTSMLAAAGQPGTLENWYKFDRPRVFAKTGSLTSVHNLSGLVLTKKNNWILFSFMNNHFSGSNEQVKINMNRALELIIENY